MLRGLVRVLFIACLAFACAGCSERTIPVPAKATGSSTSVAPASNPVSAAQPRPTVTSAAVERTLEEAHKDYLAAYDRYVKMLRESGPQTMETLGALAEYQRKYQTYQLLLGNAKPSR